MKYNLVEALKAEGFVVVENESEILRERGITLERSWEKEVEVAFHGTYTSTLKVRLFVNPTAAQCYACFSNGGRSPYKEKWYASLGKRTYNAIAETVQYAGFNM